jgi:hypothetical protein
MGRAAFQKSYFQSQPPVPPPPLCFFYGAAGVKASVSIGIGVCLYFQIKSPNKSHDAVIGSNYWLWLRDMFVFSNQITKQIP